MLTTGDLHEIYILRIGRVEVGGLGVETTHLYLHRHLIIKYYALFKMSYSLKKLNSNFDIEARVIY